MFNIIPYFNHKLCHQGMPDSKLQLCQQPPSPAGNSLGIRADFNGTCAHCGWSAVGGPTWRWSLAGAQGLAGDVVNIKTILILRLT